MSASNNRDPAFPVFLVADEYFGLTKRDYFAAVALSSLLTDFDSQPSLNSSRAAKYAEITADAYAVADAMMEARKS